MLSTASDLCDYLCTDKVRSPVHLSPVNPVGVIVLRYSFRLRFLVLSNDSRTLLPVSDELVLPKSISQVVAQVSDGAIDLFVSSA